MYAKIFLIVSLLLNSCMQNAADERDVALLSSEPNGVNNPVNPYQKIEEIPLPAGYKRISFSQVGFATWLRKLPLKKDKLVYLYNGVLKSNQAAQFAVLDIPVGKKDLQQCADAVMRLRATFQFDQQAYDKIFFRDNERRAYRFTVPHTRKNLDVFLERVFQRCGSASLEKQLHKKSLEQIRPGDVLIRGGFPGHVVMVMDLAENARGEKVFMLAQSYMPAQDIHVLLNPGSEKNSPWYPLTDAAHILTPEYHFRNTELRGW
ncbi:MAG: DUF4846 domain-containing protein [Bacteroidota bacterium]